MIHNSTPSYFADEIQLVRPFPGDTPDDTCGLVVVGSPPGWHTFSPQLTLWEVDDMNSPLLSGQTQVGFSIATTRPCCWDAALHNFLLLDDPTIGNICLACPTAARGSSWGALKAIYR